MISFECGRWKKWTPLPAEDGDGLLIPLTKGQFARIDTADLSIVAPYTWSYWETCGNRYARSCLHQNGKRSVFCMHRLIVPPPPGLVVDHRDRDGLNNRRQNLRHATHTQNRVNGFSARGASRFKGVSPYRWGGFQANIQADGRAVYLGRFQNEEDAARAYDAAAATHYGEFALTNAALGLLRSVADLIPIPGEKP